VVAVVGKDKSPVGYIFMKLALSCALNCTQLMAADIAEGVMEDIVALQSSTFSCRFTGIVVYSIREFSRLDGIAGRYPQSPDRYLSRIKVNLSPLDRFTVM